MDNSDSEASPKLDELRQAVRDHLDASVAAARQGLAVAGTTGQAALQSFFERCLATLERAQAEAHSDMDPAHRSNAEAPSGEQVSEATFASGDGANDAQVTPEVGRGKAGNWPSY